MYEFSKISEAYNGGVDFIVPTTPLIEDTFDEFNALMFNNKLRKVEFGVSTESPSKIGECIIETVDGVSSVKRILICGIFSYSRHMFEDILLHEMIHLENIQFFQSQLLTNGAIDPAKQHTTRCFVTEMSRLNNEFGRHVAVYQDIHDKTNIKRIMEIKTMDSDVLDDISYYCVHNDGINVKIYRVRDSLQQSLVKKIYDKFDNETIEVIKPANAVDYNGYFSKLLDYTMTIPEGERFNKFKNDVTTVVESSRSVPPMTEWAKRSLENGCEVKYDGESWVVVLSD